MQTRGRRDVCSSVRGGGPVPDLLSRVGQQSRTVEQFVDFAVEAGHAVSGVVVAHAQLVEAAVDGDGGDVIDHGVAAVREHAARGPGSMRGTSGRAPSTLHGHGERDHDLRY